MKNITFLILLFTFSLTGCAGVSEQDIVHLNGYWEIEEVQSHGENFNPRGGNILVDYYKIDSMQGYRKKLAPSFGPEYASSEAQFNLLIEQIEGDYYLVYKKALKPWKEKIKVLNQNRLELEHQDKVYIYKRHEKISL
jgi:hypothetical protein|tara:strand:+ start:16319 stop:16732 length:414 start_codon:yes stop_codon:yes gene_type:complete